MRFLNDALCEMRMSVLLGLRLPHDSFEKRYLGKTGTPAPNSAMGSRTQAARGRELLERIRASYAVPYRFTFVCASTHIC